MTRPNFGRRWRKMQFDPKPWIPKPYMLRAAKFLVQRGAAALFLDPGLCKTAITLAAYKALRKRKLANKALVVAPLRVCYSVWPEEVNKWLDFVDLRVEVLHGPKKGEALEREADLYVINPEGLPWLFDRKRLKPRTLKRRGFDVLVLDELSKFKDTQTLRFRTLKPLLPYFSRRWGLTGSPVANGLLGLFGQMYALDQGRTLGAYYSHFRVQYFLPQDAQGYAWAPMEDAEERILRRLRPLALRMSAEEYLKLPPRTFQNVYVDLPPKARRAYESMEAVFFADLEGGKAVTVAHGGASSMKCRQIASGLVYDDVRESVLVHKAKQEALAELAAELQGKPLLIAYEFVPEVAAIREALGVKPADAPYIGGGVSAANGEAIIRKWNAGELPYLLAHTQSLGHGVNLQKGGRHVVFFSLTWNQELYDQFVRRVWRMGTKRRVFVYHLLARDTVDEVVCKTLRAKTRRQDAFLDALRKYKESKTRRNERG